MGDNIYKIPFYFDKMYAVMDEATASDGVPDR